MAIVSQLQNVLQIGVNISNAGINNGIIKYLAQYHNNKSKRELFIYTSLFLVFIIASLLGIIVFFMPIFFSGIVFNSDQYVPIIKLTGIYLITTALLNLIISILNGLKQLKNFISLNIFLSLSGFAVVFGSVYFWGLRGMMMGIIFQTSLALIFGIYLLFRKLRIDKIKFSTAVIRRLSKYSLMSVAAGILSPLTLLLCRNIIISHTSLQSAGLWDGVNKISNNYILLATMSFSYYFLPTFSSITSPTKIRKEVINAYKILVPLLLVGGVMLYALRKPVVTVLFSPDFNGITEILNWQIIGDGIRVLTWVISILIIAKEKVTIYIGSELISSLSQIGFTYYFVLHMGIEGSTFAYFMENIISFFIMVGLFYFYWEKSK
ncbi:MAG: O-antigen translocase [Marinilabiliaceae bacterium]|nr:O-antigen translocase [Marinilabiliaceae bacterium]